MFYDISSRTRKELNLVKKFFYVTNSSKGRNPSFKNKKWFINIVTLQLILYS